MTTENKTDPAASASQNRATKIGTHTLTPREQLELRAMENDLTIEELLHIEAIYGEIAS